MLASSSYIEGYTILNEHSFSTTSILPALAVLLLFLCSDIVLVFVYITNESILFYDFELPTASGALGNGRIPVYQHP